MSTKQVAWKHRHTLPAQPGVYYCYSRFRLLYVGESSNLRRRWTDNSGYGPHHKTDELKRNGVTHIRYKVYLNERRRKHEEAIAIDRYSPPLNYRKETPSVLLSIQDAVTHGLLIAGALAVFGLIVRGTISDARCDIETGGLAARSCWTPAGRATP
jgi:hypothetical protein